MILIILSGFTFYQLALLSMNSYNSTTTTMNQADWNKSNEELTILSIQTTQENQLNITVKNTGNAQSLVKWIGIFNRSVTPEHQEYVSVNVPIAIGENRSISPSVKITPNQIYVVQLVTEAGNVYDCTLYPASLATLSLTLVAVPATVYQGNNITLFATITNNNINNIAVENINLEATADPSGLVSNLTSSQQTITTLAPSESAFITWIYATTIGQTQTRTVTFNVTYNQVDTASAIAEVSILPVPTGSGDQGQITIAGTYQNTQYHAEQIQLLDETTHINGSLTEDSLKYSDFIVETFESYFTGTASTINHFVNSMDSNVDGSPNIGTINNFPGMQTGPEGTNATLTEAAISYSEIFGNSDNPSSDSRQIRENRIRGSKYNSGTAEGILESISFYGRSSNQPVNTRAAIYDEDGTFIAISQQISVQSANWYTATFNQRLIIDSDTNYWLMIMAQTNRVNIYLSTNNGGESHFQTMDYGSTEDLVLGTPTTERLCIYATVSNTENYQLDFEVQWTNVDTSADVNNLAICLDSQSGSEELAVDAWIIDHWETQFSSLSSGWNNISVTPSSTFTIRFRDTNPIGDINENSWIIAAALIQQTDITSQQFTCSVEFSGSSNTEEWVSFIWNVQTYFNISGIDVIIQFFDYSTGLYMSSGEGFASFQTIADLNHITNDSITANLERFKDNTGTWKVKITAIGTTDPFMMSVNWIQIEPTYESGGDSIEYGVFQDYIIEVTDNTGTPIPYAYMSIFLNGTSVNLLNSLTNQTIANPGFVTLDSNGLYQLRLQSTSELSETITIIVSVGTTTAEKSILQEAP